MGYIIKILGKNKTLSGTCFFTSFLLTLVLVLLVLLVLLINCRFNVVKSRAHIYIVFHENTPSKKVDDVCMRVKSKEWIKSLNLISSKQALNMVEKNMGVKLPRHFSNPLPYSADIFVKPRFLKEKQMNNIKNELLQYSSVEDVLLPSRLIMSYEHSYKHFLSFSLLFLCGFIIIEIAIFLLTGRLFYLNLREDVLTLKLLGCSSEKIKLLLMSGLFLVSFAGIVLAAITSLGVVVFIRDFIQNVAFLGNSDFLSACGFSLIAVLFNIFVLFLCTLFAVRNEKL